MLYSGKDASKDADGKIVYQFESELATFATAATVDEDIFLTLRTQAQAANISLIVAEQNEQTGIRTDEDYFENPVVKILSSNTTLPVWILDWQYDQHEVTAKLDEDYFLVATPRANTANTPPYFFHTDEASVQPLPVDEVFWQNQVAPVTIPNLVPMQASGEEFFPAHQVIGQPDEDYWQNPVSAATVPNQAPAPHSFESHDPSGPLFGQPDEDFWQNPTAAVTIPNRFPQQSIFEQHDPGGLFAHIDEDFWLNPVFAVSTPNIAPQQFVFEQHESGGSLYARVDEDFWLNPSAPVTYPNRLVLQWVFEQGEQVASLHGPFEDDSIYPLPLPIAGALAWPAPWAGAEDVPTVYQAHEDYFLQPVAPATAFMFQPLPIFYDETQIVPQPLYGGNEDYCSPLPQSVPVLQTLPTWPWAFSAGLDDFVFVVVNGRTWISFIR